MKLLNKPRALVAGLTLALGVAGLSQSVSADEVLLKHHDLNLRADLNLAEDKSLADGVVLMLHGTLAHNRMEIVSTTAELLNDAGYNTLAINLSYAIDQRAEGMLDCNIDHKHKHEDAIDELAAWMNWLQEQGASKVAIWGHSRGGGQVSWYASEQDSELLEKLILVAPATYDAEAAAASYEKRFGMKLADLMAEADQRITANNTEAFMEVPGFVYCENVRVQPASFISYGKEDPRKSTPNNLPKISKPTLVIIGSADEVVADLPEQLAGFSQDNMSVETVDGADHFFRDLYADEMVELITDFLAWD